MKAKLPQHYTAFVTCSIPKGKQKSPEPLDLTTHARHPRTTLDGINVTSIDRTVFDCLRMYDFRAALALADSALRVSNKQQTEFLTAFAAFRKSHKYYNRALDILLLADGRSENGGESVARAVMIEQGYKIPDLQTEIRDPINPAQMFRVDFRWDLSTGVVFGALDGQEKYTNPTMMNGSNTIDVLTNEHL